MKDYISSRYIDEKLYPIKNLIKIVDAEQESLEHSGNLTEELSEYQRNEIAFAFAVIAKEMGVKIPDV